MNKEYTKWRRFLAVVGFISLPFWGFVIVKILIAFVQANVIAWTA